MKLHILGLTIGSIVCALAFEQVDIFKPLVHVWWFISGFLFMNWLIRASWD